MAKYAKGKKSYAISDRGGQRVRYTQLKTTWDGLRVAPDEWEPKHPQLTPAKNVIDAQQLFQPRSTGQSQEDAIVYIGYAFDPFLPIQERPPVGCPGIGRSGLIDSSDLIQSVVINATGAGGTSAVGDTTPEIITVATATGVAGTGGVSVQSSVAYVGYSVTVAPGSGNKFYIDSVLQQQLYLQEGQTYRFDQSDSSNSGHPLRFSTTPNGSHGGGSEYTTGVTTNGTPGSSGAYTEITVASGAPTLYYYCTNHSNMGGTSYTPASGTISVSMTVANPGSGNKYYIDTGGPAPTISITETGTYRFDQSDSSNSGHPLRFSTTSGGSHSGGSEYTTGVTTNGTPGSAGAYTEITVAASAPTLYYYCTNHSGMGGKLNTPAITPAVPGLTVDQEFNATGSGGSGGVGSGTVVGNPVATGIGGTGAVGNEVGLGAAVETGVGGTGGLGTINATNIDIENDNTWGTGTWSSGTWGN
tara:strand:+ start:74 stop:1489 length:1416 start_codon:yes stop_codon:yes gene_type:complete